MALEWSDITSKVQRHIIPRLIDTVYLSSPVFTRLRTQNGERFEGGTKISQPLVYAEVNGGPYARGGTFNVAYVPTDTALDLNIKYYYANITAYGPDNVLARGPEQAMSYMESKFFNAAGKMAKNLASDFYKDGTGVSSATIAVDGLLQALDNGNTYTSYGNITRADLGVANGTNNQGLNAYVNTLASYTHLGLQTAFGSSYFGNEHVDLIVTTQTVWNLIESKILPQQRFMESDTDVAKIGFSSLRWKGASIVVDQYCPSGYVFGLNSKYVQFWTSALPRYQFGSKVPCESQGSVDADYDLPMAA